MMISEGRDLRQMRDTKNLVSRRQLLQLLPDSFRRLAADARVHFVEDQRLLPPIYSEHSAQCEHDARQFPARSHSFQWPRFFARIGRNQQLRTIDSADTAR